MVQAQFVELATAVHSVQAHLMFSEAARSNLQARVERLGRTIVERKIGVDTRNFGRLSHFNGIADWSVVLREEVHREIVDERSAGSVPQKPLAYDHRLTARSSDVSKSS